MHDTTLHAFLTSRGYTEIRLARNAVGHFELDAAIDGTTLRFLLDTGASRTVLDAGAAMRLGLALESSEQRAGGVGTASHAVQLTTVGSFSIGQVALGSRRVAVLDLSHVSASLTGHGGNAIDGAIGGDILGERDAIIEYTTAALYLASTR
ncbi:MAG TPA: retropepsin-like aspartic protease [Thermoanaerobaculia bacterium]|jgi:aspartyl protease family protein